MDQSVSINFNKPHFILLLDIQKFNEHILFLRVVVYTQKLHFLNREILSYIFSDI